MIIPPGTLRRRPLAAALGAVVLVQLAAYAGTYFATYLDPVEHIRSSFFRIAAALLPLALVAVSGGLGGPDRARTPPAAREGPPVPGA